MKVFIQIPCLNEEETLPMVFEKMPKTLPYVDEVEWLIIDDGCTDKTVEVAKKLGVRHFVHHRKTMGLARSFRDGVDYALKHGADIVVNTDGDNQYPQDRIADLVKPIIDGEAEIVIGDRQTAKISDFSGFKKIMQRFGSWVVNKAGGTNLPDAPSGFRAYSRYSLYRLNIVTQFSYAMETIIQSGTKQLNIVSIPITTNKKTRESRLFKNIWQHMGKSGQAIIRNFVMYKPHAIFVTLGLIFFVAAAIPFVRFLYFVAIGESAGHVQSLIFGTAMLLGAMLSFALLVIADLLKTNRILLEDLEERVKEIQYSSKK
ncbi:MAG TPA: glycosyltransferase family 2 protein [Candidatus Saccharibacteria bacterium]|nr:glycosyltransferase family 2 protein [Candidatus Saccharibacteria bacterium]